MVEVAATLVGVHHQRESGVGEVTAIAEAEVALNIIAISMLLIRLMLGKKNMFYFTQCK